MGESATEQNGFQNYILHRKINNKIYVNCHFMHDFKTISLSNIYTEKSSNDIPNRFILPWLSFTFYQNHYLRKHKDNIVFS